MNAEPQKTQKRKQLFDAAAQDVDTSARERKHIRRKAVRQPTDEELGELFFNSKMTTACLSNFFGGVESSYQYYTKFKECIAAKRLFDHFDTCSKADFVTMLQQLQPGKKFTPAKISYWFDPDGSPIRGILAKLAAGALREDKVHNKRRWKAIVDLGRKLAPGEPDIQPLSPPMPHDQRLVVMKECLQRKYSDPHYRVRLLATGNRPLHEQVRGNGAGSFWGFNRDAQGIGRGHDALGKMLVDIRTQLRADDNIDNIDVIDVCGDVSD